MQIIPFASGKGGVGKSTVVVNVGLSLALSGKKVILVDLDLGGANLHSFLGISDIQRGLGDFIGSSYKSLRNLVVPTSYRNLYLLPGDSLYVGMANLPFLTKKKLIKHLRELSADFILVDLGAGTSNNVIDFFLMSYSGVVVMVPEVTSVMNAYALLKNAFFRLLYLSFPKDSSERLAMVEFIKQKIEGSSLTLYHMISLFEKISPASAILARKIAGRFYPRLILNRVEDYSVDLEMGNRFINLLRDNIGFPAEYIGWLGSSRSELKEAMIQKKPYLSTQPHVETADLLGKGLHFIAQNMIKAPEIGSPYLYDDLDDMLEKQDNFMHLATKKLQGDSYASERK